MESENNNAKCFVDLFQIIEDSKSQFQSLCQFDYKDSYRDNFYNVSCSDKILVSKGRYNEIIGDCDKIVNQDQGFIGSHQRTYGVFDGCGSCIESETGSKKIADFMSMRSRDVTTDNLEKIISAFFEDLLKSRMDRKELDKYNFTMLICIEDKAFFYVYTLGDGYILLQNKNNNIEILKLTNNFNIANGEAPEYFLYNFKARTPYDCKYNCFLEKKFSKSNYKNIFLASDGVRFILESENTKIINEFKGLLIKKDKHELEKFLLENEKILKDDVIICG